MKRNTAGWGKRPDPVFFMIFSKHTGKIEKPSLL